MESRIPASERTSQKLNELLTQGVAEGDARSELIFRTPSGERPVLKLMYAAVIRAADRWGGLTVGEVEQRQLRAIRDELDRAHAERTRPAARQIHTPPSPGRRARRPRPTDAIGCR